MFVNYKAHVLYALKYRVFVIYSIVRKRASANNVSCDLKPSHIIRSRHDIQKVPGLDDDQPFAEDISTVKYSFLQSQKTTG